MNVQHTYAYMCTIRYTSCTPQPSIKEMASAETETLLIILKSLPCSQIIIIPITSNQVLMMEALRDSHKFDLSKITALTPYSAQRNEIKREMERRGVVGPQVKTITQSQGAWNYTLLSDVREIHKVVVIAGQGL